MTSHGETPILETFVVPPSPVKLPERSSADGVTLSDGRRIRRFLHVAGAPVVVTAAESRDAGAIRLAAEAVEPERITYPPEDSRAASRRLATPRDLEESLSMMRFALCLDQNLGGFFSVYRDDDLLGPVIARRPWARPERRPVPWEALAWAVIERGEEPGEAARIQRRMIHRWGPRVTLDGSSEIELHDVPSPQTLADAAPAELVSKGLTEPRTLSLARCAREIVTGRADPEIAQRCDRLAGVSGIDSTVLATLASSGRGDPDALAAADQTLSRLVGRLASLGRRASEAEVDEFFSGYRPWRALAAAFALAGYQRAVVEGPRLKAVA